MEESRDGKISDTSGLEERLFEDKEYERAVLEEADDVDVSGWLPLLERRREMLQVEEELGEKRSWYSKKMTELREMEGKIAKKRAEIQQNLLRFDKFIRDNESKRLRAQKKVGEEAALQQDRLKKVEELEDMIDTMTKQRAQSQEEVEKISAYVAYLERVAEGSEEMHDISDILLRYTVLHESNIQLRERISAAEHSIQELQEAVLQRKFDAENKVLRMNTEMQLKQRELEKYQSGVLDAQGMHEREIEKERETKHQIGEIHMASRSIYEKCVRVSRIPRLVLKEGDTIKQLRVIKQFIQDYQYIASSSKEH
eukprot:TRINITY_DN2318_c0_g1_i1.p1 TRINITY_DN2318_c0_g1~~TRINITY_DN2318_c0_g1_i1.p1  ORF type:complete len:312 (-),score=113.56 TRINITY_DN2318_c0_g1_i1:60-995(-)